MASSTTTIDSKQFPATAEFLAWYEGEKASAGLLDIQFCPANVENATADSFFSEVNRALAAETVNDSELV